MLAFFWSGFKPRPPQKRVRVETTETLIPIDLKSHDIRADELTGYGRQSGMALVWILITMVIMSTVGSAMVSFYTVTTVEQQGAGMFQQARFMAESGRRFFEAEYRNQSGEKNKNEWMADDLHGNTFNPVAGESNRFKLDLTSHFYRAAADLSAGSTLRLRFVGSGGFDPTNFSSGSLRIEGDSTLFSFGSAPTTSGSGNDTIYRFTVTPSIPATSEYTGVYTVVSSNYSGVSDGGTLTLDSGLGELFPDENGMFLIEKSEILTNLPVPTTVPYRYAYRDGDRLVNVTRGPKQSRFIAIDAASPGSIEVAKFVEVQSTGLFESEASVTNTYRLAVPSPTSTPGLKSSWSFDDTGGTSAADDYGTNDGALQGDAQFVESATNPSDVKVGTGAVDFGGTGYIETTFNPATELVAQGNVQFFTLAFWAKPDALPLAGFFSLQVVVGASELSGAENFYVGILRLQPNTKWIWGLGNRYEWTTPDLPDVQPGVWQHVVFQYLYDESVQRYYTVFYINGREAYRRQYTGTADVADVDVVLGALPSSGGILWKYQGVLDEVAVFNKALDFCEVNSVFEVAGELPCTEGCDADLYYDFNGSADDVSGSDWTGNGYDGTVVGATSTEDRCDLAGRAYYFNWTDYIDTSFNPRTVIGNLSPFTVAFWAKPSQVSTLRSAFGVIDSDTSPSERFYVYVYNGDWSWGYGNKVAPSASRPAATAGVWSHVAFVYDNNVEADGTDDEIRFYINGQEYTYAYDTVNDSPPASGILPNYSAYVGARNTDTGVNATWSGSVDEVLVWTEAKTAAEIQEIYETTSP